MCIELCLDAEGGCFDGQVRRVPGGFLKAISRSIWKGEVGCTFFLSKSTETGKG